MTKLKSIRNQFVAFASAIAMMVEFVILGQYVFADVFKEFGNFTNNFVWLFALFFTIGGLVYALIKKKKPTNTTHTSVMMVVWGGALLLVGVLSISVVQALVPTLKVNSVTIVLPAIYAVLLAIAGAFQYAIFANLSASLSAEGKSIFTPALLGVVVSLVVFMITPRYLSYKAVIIMASVLLLIGALAYEDRRAVSVQEVACENECGCKVSAKPNLVNIIVMLVSLAVLVFVEMISVSNITFFAAKYQYDNSAVYLMVAICMLALYFGYMGGRKCPKCAGKMIASVVMYVVGYIILVCSGDYIAVLFANVIKCIALGVMFTTLCARLAPWYREQREIAKCGIVMGIIVLPMVLGYWAGIVLTMGNGYMVDILAGVYIEPFRSNAEYAQGLISREGAYAQYVGIGEKVRLSTKRFGYVPNNLLYLIPMICGGAVAVASQLVAIFVKGKPSAKAQLSECASEQTESAGEAIEQVSEVENSQER